jgi:hypothetical protein
MILFRSFAADHLEGISESFSKTVISVYPCCDNSNAVDNPNAPPPMIAICSFFEMTIVTGCGDRGSDDKSGEARKCDVHLLKAASHYNTPTINGRQFRGARRVTSIRAKSPETIGIVVLSISSACISVKVMRCCPAAAAVRTHHRQAYRVRHGHETDTNSTRHPHTYHRHPRCNGQVTISYGQEGTINAIQSASEAGIRCHCIPWLIPA